MKMFKLFIVAILGCYGVLCVAMSVARPDEPSEFCKPQNYQPEVYYWIEVAVKDKNTGEFLDAIKVNQDRNFKGSDIFRFGLSSKCSGYLYLMHRTNGVSPESFELVFPAEMGSDVNIIEANEPIYIPKTRWYQFEGSHGEEQFKLVFLPDVVDAQHIREIIGMENHRWILDDLSKKKKTLIAKRTKTRGTLLTADLSPKQDKKTETMAPDRRARPIVIEFALKFTNQ